MESAVPGGRFPQFKQALLAWTTEVAGHLSDSGATHSGVRTTWARDADGIYRRRERPQHYLRPEYFQGFPTWAGVLQAIEQEPILERQFGLMVGTALQSARLDPWTVAAHVLPEANGDETSQATEFSWSFDERYQECETFLAATHLTYLIAFPIPGLSISTNEVELEESVHFGSMSEIEIVATLSVGLADPGGRALWHNEMFDVAMSPLSCVRYRYTLPKMIGADSSAEEADVIFKDFDQVQSMIEQASALLSISIPMIAGQVQYVEGWHGWHGGLAYVPNLRIKPSFQQVDLDEEKVTELAAAWKLLSRPALQLELRRAARRFGYRRERHRDEDRLVDMLVTAESLYIPEDARTELSYRQALHAAIYADPARLDMTRSEVYQLMTAAYKVRSSLVHGSAARAKDMKIKGAAVPLHQFLAAVEEVVRQALECALTDSAQQRWPPPWEEMLLSEVQPSRADEVQDP